MVESLRIDSGKVSWIYNLKDINIEIEDAFFVSKSDETELITINSGKDFIGKKIYYYDYNGNLILSYDLELGTIVWVYQGLRKNLNISNLKDVGFFPQKQRILVLCQYEKQELHGYNLDGQLLFSVNDPPEFEMRYFVQIDDQIAVVCDGNQNQQDEYGRFRFHFLIDLDNGRLTKGTLAY